MKYGFSLLFVLFLGADVAVADQPPPSEVIIRANADPVALRVFFAKNKSTPLKSSQVVLDDLAKTLKDSPEITKIEISGYADPRTEKKKAQKLSEQRAEWAYKYLLSKGIDPSRLVVKGYADSAPADEGKTKQGQSKNRRLEFKVIERE